MEKKLKCREMEIDKTDLCDRDLQCTCCLSQAKIRGERECIREREKKREKKRKKQKKNGFRDGSEQIKKEGKYQKILRVL